MPEAKRYSPPRRSGFEMITLGGKDAARKLSSADRSGKSSVWVSVTDSLRLSPVLVVRSGGKHVTVFRTAVVPNTETGWVAR